MFVKLGNNFNFELQHSLLISSRIAPICVNIFAVKNKMFEQIVKQYLIIILYIFV